MPHDCGLSPHQAVQELWNRATGIKNGGFMKRTDVFLASFSVFSLLRKRKKMQENASPSDVVEVAMGCPAIRPMQITTEFLELAKLVGEQQCKYLLEIGTYMGGTLFVYSQLAAADATVISIDFPTTLVGRLYRVCQKPLFRRLIRRGQSLFFLRRDSHKPETVARMREVLRENELDFLFIDGDHSYEGVRSDFEMYAPLVRAGGLIAFHDITPSKGSRQVYRFWDEIKGSYTHKEFIHRTGEGAMGIGVLWI
jgi:cephalosporin hydroxylase